MPTNRPSTPSTAGLLRAVASAIREEDVAPWSALVAAVARQADAVVVVLEDAGPAGLVVVSAGIGPSRGGDAGEAGLVDLRLDAAELPSPDADGTVATDQLPAGLLERVRLDTDARSHLIPWSVALASVPDLDRSAFSPDQGARRTGWLWVAPTQAIDHADVLASLEVVLLALELSDSRDWFAGVSLAAEAVASERHAELTEAKELVDGIGTSLGHEVRDALRGVMGWARLASSPDIGEGVREEMLLQIQRATETASAAVGDSLEMIHEGQARRVEHSPVDLNALVSWATELLAPKVTEARATVVAAHLPTVIASPTVLRLALVELLRNALEHGGRYVRITVEGHIEDEGLVLRVRDNGPGLDEALLENAFDAGVSTGMGAGYGLTRTREALREHGGRVWFDSVDDGAEVVLLLPQSATVSANSDAGADL